MSEHRELLEWIDECAKLCEPDRIVWIDGSEEEKERLTQEALTTGELLPMDQEKWPGCVYHRTAVNDVARTEDLTFICTTLQDDAGPTNNWMSPEEGYRRAGEIFKGSMKGRTMYVIPFSMGPVGSPFSKVGVELTDSIYVVLNMRIMTRIGTPVLKHLGTKGEFTRCLHSKAELDIKRRLILHFPEDNAIWSVGSGYGGNVLLGKKCLALRIASHMGKREGWMAEHMLIMGIEDPTGRIEYVAAAFPSACGKTNLAMLLPPEGLQAKGYRIWTVGDDIAWMRIDTDGRLWAINPESGYFGVAPGTNMKTNPNMMKTIQRDTIFTNVVLGNDGDVWWEDGEGAPPAEGWDWQGRPWKPGMLDENGKPILGAHPNSRFTAPFSQCPTASFRAEHHHGVPISAIIFGGRRAQLAPLVYESFDWEHGVFVGATMASERTAAQFGKVGEVRRDPMAMLPFCGYHMGDYFEHWLDMGRRMSQPPKVFHVNWFRQDEDGKYLWPGFGENLRVIEWVLARCRGEADAQETAIGYVPTVNSLDMTGLEDLPQENLKKLFSVNREAWKEELNLIEPFFEKLGKRLPKEMREQQESLRTRLEAPISMLRPGSEIRGLANELNDIIEIENPAVLEMLSQFGKRIYFPKGILSQSAEAKEKAKKFDATIGIAYENGKPMYLPSIMKYFAGLTPGEALTYAPATGRPDLRKLWQQQLLEKNPSLQGKRFSMPIVTNGVTHALSLVGDLFLDKDDMVLLPDKFWENYDLLFGVRLSAQLAVYPFFTEEGGFNVEALRQVLANRVGCKTLLVLNFPNNPTGYTITVAEAEAITNVLREAAENGCQLVVVCDDAYFGLFYAEDALQESLFGRIASLHENLLAVKVDGPTKEEYVWGFRTGMLTFSTKAKLSDEKLYAALEKKAAGAIRSAISNCAHPSQSVLVKAMADETFAAECQEKRAILETRAHTVQTILQNPAYADLWEPYPFNAGYFMCLKLKGIDAETYRKHLLEKYGVGVIADGKHDIRVAFSAVENAQLTELYDVLAKAARELHGEQVQLVHG